MDFDMTLVDHTSEGVRLPQETQKLLTSLIDRGLDVGIVSGRYWWEMKDILEQLGMKWGAPFPSFIITREAFIYRLNGNEMRQDEEWNRKHMTEIADFMKRLSGRTSHILNRLEALGLRVGRWIIYSDYAFEIHFQNEEVAEMALNPIQEWLNEYGLDGKTHRNRSVANVIFSRIGKGNTLLRLSESQNLKPGEVLAIGDSLNDLDMLDGVLGFQSGAVGNADKKIQEVVRAHYGVVANERAGWGVAKIIREYEKRGLI